MPQATAVIEGWTYGAELEFVDWDRRAGLPEGMYTTYDYTLVNSSGVAVQKNVVLYPYGGEVNSKPTTTICGQLSQIEKFLAKHPTARFNYRSAIHIHIGVPRLKDDLGSLKKIQQAVHIMREVFNHICPIDVDQITPLSRSWVKWARRSRLTLLTPHRLARQLSAVSPDEFFRYEVPVSKTGQVMWHAQPRVCVNLRQLLQTNTVEFRHFHGSLEVEQIETAFRWCVDFLRAILSGRPLDKLWDTYCKKWFPAPCAYDDNLEQGYWCTSPVSGLSKEVIQSNIKELSHASKVTSGVVQY